MYMGTAMVLGAGHFYYGLEALSDGTAGLAQAWQPAAPDMRFSQIPQLTGGICRARCRDQFARYAQAAPPSGFRTWATTLASPPRRPAPGPSHAKIRDNGHPR